MSFWKRKPSIPTSTPALQMVDAAFVADLESLGYFRFVSAERAVAVKTEILACKHPLAVEVGREFRADGEELAEGGVRDLVGYVAPFLRREGVQIEVEYGPWRVPPNLAPDPLPYPGPTQRMRLSLERGGPLVDFEENCGDEYRLILGSRVIAFQNGWADASTQTVALLTTLLSNHGSMERAWLQYGGGNDGVVVFATEAQTARINSAVPERERLTTAGS